MKYLRSRGFKKYFQKKLPFIRCALIRLNYVDQFLMPFHTDVHQFSPYRRDCDKNRESQIIFTNEILITKRLSEYENNA